MKTKDYEETTVKKQSSIAKFAKYSTLSEEELKEANSTDDVEYDDSYGEEGNDGQDWDFREDYGDYREDDGDYRELQTDDNEEDDTEEDEPRMEHYGEIIKFTSHPTENDIFRFMFRHTYASPLGIFAALMAVGAAVVSVIEFTRQNWFYAIVFLGVFYLFAVQSPLNLKKKSKAQSQEMCSAEGAITYTFSEAGFDMERGDEYATYQWSRIIKVKNGKTGYYVYLEKNRAFIATKADLAVNEQKFVGMLERHVDNYKAPQMENL